MSESPAAGADPGTAVYVYGVVPASTRDDVFAGSRGVDPSHLVRLIRGGTAAIVSAVPLLEFGAEAIEQHLHDPAWLEEKVRAHDRVLHAAIKETSVIPLRFGAIYRDEAHVRELLEERTDFAETLDRLAGTYELGVKAVIDAAAVQRRLAAERGIADDDPTSGRAYMQRKQIERELDSAVRELAAEHAQSSHERLAALAQDARFNPPQRAVDATSQLMLLNGAYLVRTGDEPAFRTAVAQLEDAHGDDGVTYEVTGPWPPYNFVDGEEQ